MFVAERCSSFVVGLASSLDNDDDFDDENVDDEELTDMDDHVDAVDHDDHSAAVVDFPVVSSSSLSSSSS